MVHQRGRVPLALKDRAAEISRHLDDVKHEARSTQKPQSSATFLGAMASQQHSKTMVPYKTDPAIGTPHSTSNISFDSVISDSRRESIDREMIPWGSPSFLAAHPEAQSTSLETDLMLRLPFSLGDLAPSKVEGFALRPPEIEDTQDNSPKPKCTLPTFEPKKTALGSQTASFDIKPFLPLGFVSSTGVGAINLFDTNTGKIIATRNPRGGFGYDPDVNWTPETSVADGGSNAPSETLVPVNPGSKLMLPRNRVPQNPEFPYANSTSLWGLLVPQQDKGIDEDDEENGSTTIVGDENHVVQVAQVPIPPCDLALQRSNLQDQSSFAISNTINHQSSFDDVLVCRHQCDTSFTSPSTKPCSAGANMNDIAHVQYIARQLMAEHSRSDEICESVASCFERVMQLKISNAIADAKNKRVKAAVPNLVDAATELRADLLMGMEERLEMGEERAIIELELRWAEWLVESTSLGVMHLKVPGCTCRPELFDQGFERELRMKRKTL